MKKILLFCLLLALSVSAMAGNPLTRKIGQKFFDASKQLHITDETEIIVTVSVDEEGCVTILHTNSRDEKINSYVTEKIESIVLKSGSHKGIFRYKLIFKPEKK